MDRREALKALMSLPAATKVSVVSLKPNDVLVVECEGKVTDAIEARIKDTIEGVFPGHKAVVLCDGIKLKIARLDV